MYCHLPEKEKICDLYRALKTDSLFFLHCSCSTAMTTTKFQIFQVEYDLNLLAKRKIFPPPPLFSLSSAPTSYLAIMRPLPSFPIKRRYCRTSVKQEREGNLFFPSFFLHSFLEIMYFNNRNTQKKHQTSIYIINIYRNIEKW